MKKLLAILVAKQAAFWSRIFGRGGGAALPGLLAMRIYPEIVSDLTANLEKGVILVTGTNGKTTTSKMIVEILKANDEKVLSNSGGSNLTRGIASALISSSNLAGKIKEEVGVYEVDEATMPGFIKNLKLKIKKDQVLNPEKRIDGNDNTVKAIVVTNIFRDQLDRYGEVDKTAAILQKAIDNSPESTLILNADDPLVAPLGKDRKTVYYGINDHSLKAKTELAVDTKDCLVCGYELTYQDRYYGHIGVYKCPNCGFGRPATDISAQNIKTSSGKTSAEILIGGKKESLTLPMIGLFNLYNSLAAISAGDFLKIKNEKIISALNNQKPAFGRMESFEMNGKYAIIHLVKNPTGFNQVLEAITQNRKNKTALIALNDNFADGTDISWIWDSEFELFKTGFRKIIVSGTRMEDLRLRLKYANVTSRIIIAEPNLEDALETAFVETQPDEKLYILPTYTAMLEIRKTLVQKGILKNYWQ